MSQARWILVATFGILALSGLLKIDEKDSYLLGTVTLCVGSYQALLFSYTASVMLLRNKRKSIVIWAFCFITLASALLFVTKIAIPWLHPYILYPAALAYCLQLVFHTNAFRREARQTADELENYYDESTDYHLRPIKHFFYSALGIGILAGIVSMLPIPYWAYNIFVIIYTIYYIYVSVAIANYTIDGDYFLIPSAMPASISQAFKNAFPRFADTELLVEGNDATNGKTEEEIFEALGKALDEWVAKKEFTKMDVSTDHVAEQLNVTRQQLIAYFKKVHNTTFRSWRQQLRVKYACCLMHEYPDISLSQMCEQVGFNDRSNFHFSFRKYMGMNPQEYRDRIQ